MIPVHPFTVKTSVPSNVFYSKESENAVALEAGNAPIMYNPKPVVVNRCVEPSTSAAATVLNMSDRNSLIFGIGCSVAIAAIQSIALSTIIVYTGFVYGGVFPAPPGMCAAASL